MATNCKWLVRVTVALQIPFSVARIRLQTGAGCSQLCPHWAANGIILHSPFYNSHDSLGSITSNTQALELESPENCLCCGHLLSCSSVL